MEVVTVPMDPKFATSGMAQKVMVLKKQNNVKDPFEEAKLICEKNE